jgi:hypothetical protein
MKISRGIMRWKDGKMFHFLFMYTVYQRKNENFYRNYALERWKNVDCNRKDASVFFDFQNRKMF